MSQRFALPVVLLALLVVACGVTPTDPALPELTASFSKAVATGGSGVTALILQQYPPAWDPKEGVCREPYVYLIGISSVRGACTSDFVFTGNTSGSDPLIETLSGRERVRVLKLFGIPNKGVLEVQKVRLVSSNYYCIGCGEGTLTYSLACETASDSDTKTSYSCKG